MLKADDIRKIITATVVGFDSAGLADEDNFSDAGIDSLDLQGILLALEEQHGLTVADKDIEECQTISGILALAQKQVA